MIIITVALKSAISPDRDKILGVAEIGNDGTGTGEVGNYIYSLSKFNGNGIWKKGAVTGFPRGAKGPWDLLYRVLRDAVGGRNR